MTVRITIRGHRLPGRHWMSDGEPLDNVHVGVQERADPVGLVPGDAASASWDVDVRLVTLDDGTVDARGPAVHGKRGERFIYLTWGNVGADGSFDMFRRAKLMLRDVEPSLLRAGETTGAGLVADVELTDECGGPRCARVVAPAIAWSVGRGG